VSRGAPEHPVAATTGDERRADEPLPTAVRRFVARCLDTVAELEALLLVRSSPDQRWDARELAARLYIRDPQAAAVLEGLHRHALMARHGEAFFYRPATDALHREVDALASAYPRFLIPITTLIHTKSRAPGGSSPVG
jgi:hypothetical protein